RGQRPYRRPEGQGRHARVRAGGGAAAGVNPAVVAAKVGPSSPASFAATSKPLGPCLHGDDSGMQRVWPPVVPRKRGPSVLRPSRRALCCIHKAGTVLYGACTSSIARRLRAVPL